jgi:hypothetical protein
VVEEKPDEPEEPENFPPQAYQSPPPKQRVKTAGIKKSVPKEAESKLPKGARASEAKRPKSAKRLKTPKVDRGEEDYEIDEDFYLSNEFVSPLAKAILAKNSIDNETFLHLMDDIETRRLASRFSDPFYTDLFKE